MRTSIVGILLLLPALAAAQGTFGVGAGYLEVIPKAVFTPNRPDTHTGYATAPEGGSTATFALLYRRQLTQTLTFQPELHYTPFRRGEVRSKDITVPFLFRTMPAHGRGSAVVGVFMAGVAPSFQVACTVHRQFSEEVSSERCNATDPHMGHHTRRFDVALVGGFGVEARTARGWITGAEVRLTRGLRAVSVAYPEYRAQTLQLLVQIFEPPGRSASAPRAPDYGPARRRAEDVQVPSGFALGMTAISRGS